MPDATSFPVATYSVPERRIPLKEYPEYSISLWIGDGRIWPIEYKNGKRLSAFACSALNKMPFPEALPHWSKQRHAKWGCKEAFHMAVARHTLKEKIRAGKA